MKDKGSSEETKLCHYCMGEISVNATKCSHCGENIGDNNRERLKQEGKDTVKREARKQIQDKLGKKSLTQSKGVKSWWAVQSTGVKAFMVVLLGVAVIGGAYLASGTNQEIPASIINPIENQSNNSTHNNNNNPPVNRVTCPLCQGKGSYPCDNCYGTGKVNCSNCGGDGIVDSAMLEILLTVPTDPSKCYNCKGTGKVTCTECKGTGNIKCSRCNGDGYITSSS